MNVSRPIPAWAWGVLAGIIACGLAVFALGQPSMVSPHPSWFDHGLRLFRDDVEMKVYYDRSTWVTDGAAPYTSGYEQEYPPLAVAYFALPRIFTNDFDRYEQAFLGMNLVLFGLLFGLSVWLLRRFGRPIWPAWLLFLPASLYFSLWRFDILPAVLVSLLVWSVVERRFHLSLLALAAATAVKYFPAVYLLPLLMLMGSGRLAAEQSRKLRRVLTILGVSALVLAVILALTSGSALLSETLVHHLTRKYEMGSLAALVVSFLSSIKVPAGIGLRLLSLVFVLLQSAAPVVLLLRGRVPDRSGFVRACLFMIMPFILFNRFYSQQWLLWITPLYLPVARRRELIALIIFDLIDFIQFPVLFGINPYSLAFSHATLVRSAVLGYLIFVNCREMARSGYLVGPKPGSAVPAVAAVK